MPGTYETRRPRQQAELLARLALGPTLAMVCRASDMPDVKSVSNWARADPAFAAQLTEARRRGDLHRAGHFDDALAAADAAAVAAGRAPVPPHDTLLVVVGRGSSDPDANSNVAKVTRMLVEGFGFGWGETLYSGVTFPLVEPGLRQVVRLGYRRVVVFPYFLFSGVLVSRIVQHSRLVAADHPEVEFLEASYLGDHPSVLATFRERVADVLRGDTDMNCSLCKYRAQVLGFEQEVGAPQHSHHHHVEGLVESCTLCERECTGACQPDGVPLPLGGPSHGQGDHDHNHDHDHDHQHDHAHGHHGHAPYPHADHPLGPRTLRRPPG